MLTSINVALRAKNATSNVAEKSSVDKHALGTKLGTLGTMLECIASNTPFWAYQNLDMLFNMLTLHSRVRSLLSALSLFLQ